MSRYLSVKLRGRVRATFEDCCAYCKTAEALTVATFEIEHIIPISLDGPSDFDNLCLACPACNRFKSNRTHGALPDGGTVELFHPKNDNWADHFDWSVDGTVIVALTNRAAVTVNLLRMNRPQVVDIRSLWVDAGRQRLQ